MKRVPSCRKAILSTVDSLSYEALSYGNLLVMESVSGPEKIPLNLKKLILLVMEALSC